MSRRGNENASDGTSVSENDDASANVKDGAAGTVNADGHAYCRLEDEQITQSETASRNGDVAGSICGGGCSTGFDGARCRTDVGPVVAELGDTCIAAGNGVGGGATMGTGGSGVPDAVGTGD